MIYSEKDFSRCMFNPMAKGLLIDEYPRLTSIVNKEWNPQSTDKIIRYVIMAYDTNSPILKNERDSTRRKNVAYDLSGLERQGGEPDNDIITGENEVCFELIIKYLSVFVKEKEFAALCAFEFKYYENISELMSPIKGDTNAERLEAAKKKSVISDEIDKDIKRINDYWALFFGEKDIIEKVKTKKFKPETMT